MAISASTVTANQSLEEFRQEYNKLQNDVLILKDNPTYGTSIVFEGATADAHETTLTVIDPTADRTVYVPNADGTLLVTNSAAFSIADGGTIGSASDADAMTIAASGVITFSQRPIMSAGITIADAGTVGSASATSAITIASTGIVTFADDIITKDDGTIGSSSAPTAMTIDSSGIVAFVDDIKIKDGGTIGSATDIDAITIASAGAVTFSQRDVHTLGITVADDGEIGSASDTDAIAISAAGLVTLSATASLTTSGTTIHNEDVTFTGASNNVVWDKSANSLEFADSANAYFGTGLDLRIFHDGSNSYIQDGGTGSLYIEGSDISIRNVGGTEAMASFTPDGAVTLYYDNSAKIATSSVGATVTGVLSATGFTIGSAVITEAELELLDGITLGTAEASKAVVLDANGDIVIADSDKWNFGTGSDMILYHDGSDSYITNKTGALKLATETSGIAVTIGHGTSEVTIGDNLTVTGNLTVSGTQTVVDTVTMNAANAIVFEGATADAHETTLTITDPTADRTITLPNETGTVHTSGGAIVLGGDISKASDLVVDVEGDISLDANGGDIYLKDAGVIYGTLTNNGGNLTIKNSAAEVAAISIAGDEVVTFADDIIIKDGGTIGASSATSAITIASSGIVTLVDDLILKDAATIGVTSSTSAISIASTGIVTLVDDLILKDAATIGVTSATSAISIASTGIVTLADDLVIKDGGTIGVTSAADAMTVSSAGIVTFKDDILIKDAGTIGSASDPDAIAISAAGLVSLSGGGLHLTNTTPAELRWYEGANYVGFKAPSLSADQIWSLPTTDGNSGEALVTDSSGNLSFATNNIGNASTFTITANNSTNETVYPLFADTATGEHGAESDTAFTYNPSTNILTIGGNLVIGDAGNIGSASDTNAISISAAGVVDFTQNVTMQGALTVTGTTTLNGALNLGDAAADALTINATTTVNEDMTFTDNDKAIFGTGSDFQFYHDGTNSYIDNVTGGVYLRTNSTENAIVAEANSGVIVYYDGTEKFRTTSAGGTLTGTWNATTAFTPDAAGGADLGTTGAEWNDLLLNDSGTIMFGDDQEIRLRHLADQGLEIQSTHDAPLVRRGEDVYLVLDQTAAAGTDAGDNIILDRTDGGGTDAGDDIIGEDEVFIHSGMQRNVINIVGSDGKIKNSIAGFAPGAI